MLTQKTTGRITSSLWPEKSDRAWCPVTTLMLAAAILLVAAFGTAVQAASPNDASIAGYKFDDLNHNSVWDGGEPGLIDWEINLWDGPDLIDQTLTDVNGYYQFGTLNPATYRVSESNQPEWVQTYPLTVFYTIDLQEGDNLTGFDFGNCDTVCVDSVRWETCLHGTDDNFVGPEPSNMSQGLHDWIVDNVYPATVLTDFDQPASNQWFGHTFEGCWSDECVVMAATMRIKLHACSGNTSTDVLYLGDYSQGPLINGRIWGFGLPPLNAYMGGPGTWLPGQVMTAVLDLANLPPHGWEPTNILGALQDGNLDIIVADETEVDFIEIEVTLCCPACYADGDADSNGTVLSVPDLVYLSEFIEACGPAPVPLYSCDLTGDGIVDTNDINLYQAFFIYGMGVFINGFPVPCPCDPIAEPVPDTVSIFGLEHRSLGMACLEEADDTLKVTRLGRDQEAGVRIDLPDGCSGWKGYYENPECGATMPIGARVVVEYRETVEGVPDQLTGYVENLKLDTCPFDTCTWSLYVNSPATTYTVQVYREGTCVYQIEGFSFNGSRTYVKKKLLSCKTHGDSDITKTQETTYADDGTYLSRKVTYGNSDHPCGVVDIGGGPSGLEYDEILFISEQADLTPATFTSVSIWTDSIPSLSIVSETHIVDFNGIPVGNLGNAILTPVETTLVVSNITSTGNDGMDVIWSPQPDDEGERRMVEIIIENPDLGGAWPVGASLDAQYFFPGDTGEVFSMGSSFEYAGSNTWNLSVHSDSSTYTVEAFNDSVSVFSIVGTGNTDLGYIIESAKALRPVGFKGAATGKPSSTVASSDYDFTAHPDGVQWTCAPLGVSGLTIDYLSVSTEVFDPSIVGISHASMLGANGDKGDPISFTVLDIEVGLFYVCGDADASGGVDIDDVIYLIAHIFSGGPEPVPYESGDADCSGDVDIDDVVYLIAYIFSGGNAPCDTNGDEVPDC